MRKKILNKNYVTHIQTWRLYEQHGPEGQVGENTLV